MPDAKVIPFPRHYPASVSRASFGFEHIDDCMCVTIGSAETWWTLEGLELFLRIGQGMLEQAKRERQHETRND